MIISLTKGCSLLTKAGKVNCSGEIYVKDVIPLSKFATAITSKEIARIAAIKVQQTSVECLSDSGIGIYSGSEMTLLNIRR